MIPSKGRDDVLDVLHGLRLLDLGDDGQAAALLVHDAVHVQDVPPAAHEGERDDVEAAAQRPAQVVLVLLRQGGHGHRDAGQVEALVVGDHAALDHPGAHPGPVDAGHLQADLAVVDEDALTGGDVLGEARVRRTAGVAVARDAVLDGDGEAVTAFKEYGPFTEVAEADLRALKVGEGADAAARLVGRLAYPAVALFVFGVGAVAEIEAGDVHTGVDQVLDLVVRVGGGPKSTDDLCSAHESSL
ncbi:hypothetical protein RKD37_006620 [Streptomyces ambofaciens]